MKRKNNRFYLPIMLLMSLLLSLSQLWLRAQEPQQKIRVSDALEIVPLSENMLQHISYLQTASFGRVACNGLVYFNQNEAIIMDTPATVEQSQELIDWLRREYPHLKLQAVVVTHFHEDAIAGLPVFHRQGIPSYANRLTKALAARENLPLPQHTFKKSLRLKVGNAMVMSRYFGAAHTKDNIVCWIPAEQTMFGGCMIKALDAAKGNLADANTGQWSKTVRKAAKTYSSVKRVVPGHGAIGGPELLQYTIDLFKPAGVAE